MLNDNYFEAMTMMLYNHELLYFVENNPRLDITDTYILSTTLDIVKDILLTDMSKNNDATGEQSMNMMLSYIEIDSE